MDSEKIKVTSDQKDWDDFFASWDDTKDAIASMDAYAERVRLACELSGRQIKEATKRLDESTKEKIRITVEFEFDR